MPTKTRQTAEERRETVLQAAVVEFAAGGLTGTSTEAIARRAGISQPYLFRLFPTKKALFLAVVERAFSRVEERFEAAAEGLTGEEARTAMGVSYSELLGDRSWLLVQLHAYAASEDLDVRTVTRRGFRNLWLTVERSSGLGEAELRDFFATGMLLNTVAALDLPALDERWAQICTDLD